MHAERGLVDAHGLSDVNWAAVAFGLAESDQIARLWPQLLNDNGFWVGEMPTQIVTRPFTYEPWELHEPLPFPVMSPLHDIAAMGRVGIWRPWPASGNPRGTACRPRCVTCAAASADGYWRERYHPQPDGSVRPAGAEKYCEYPAVLVRVAFANRMWLNAGS